MVEAPRAGEDETVLMMGDEPTVRMLVAEVMENPGYGTIKAADSIARLTVLQSNVRIDLLVTDVGLSGGMKGRQLADGSQDRRPGLKVRFITGYAGNPTIDHDHPEPRVQVPTEPFVIEALDVPHPRPHPAALTPSRLQGRHGLHEPFANPVCDAT